MPRAKRAGFCPFAERVVAVGRQVLRRRPATRSTGVFFIRKDIMDAKGLKLPKVYDPDVVEIAKKAQDPSKDLWGFGQTLNRSDDGNGFMQNILWNYGGGVWDKDGKPALGDDVPEAEPGGAAVRGGHASRSTRSSRRASWAGPTSTTTRPTWRASW